MTRINGYVVVRLPQWNEVATDVVLPSIGPLWYEGLDRWEWADVFDEDYYVGRMPPEIRLLADGIEESGRNSPCVRLTPNYEHAKQLEQYSNRFRERNELVAIASEPLAEFNGVFDAEKRINWLGYDVVAEGEWSLIAGGIFTNPAVNEEWVADLNQHGLFDDERRLAEYVEHYQNQVSAGALEELASAEAGLRIISIRVGRPISD